MERIRRRTLIVSMGHDTPCYLYTGTLTHDGYGTIGVTVAPYTSVTKYVHVLAYSEHEAIPDGYQVDHLCRIRNCWRYEHLEAVTPQENGHRTVLSVCRRGHDLTLPRARTPGQACRECWNASMRAYNKEKKPWRDRYKK